MEMMTKQQKEVLNVTCTDLIKKNFIIMEMTMVQQKEALKTKYNRKKCRVCDVFFF
jgi:hypothetical protein